MVKLRSYDKKEITDPVYQEDLERAEKVGKVRLGEKAVYYKDGLRWFCYPYEVIDRAFTRISGCQARTCCSNVPYDYYRLVLVHEDREIANIIFGEKEEPVDEAEAKIKQRAPHVEIGYVKPDNK